VSLPSLRVRRATTDDLPALKSLWEAMRLPAEDLESRLTEFQVAESDGQIVGALAVQISRQHARFHSEGYMDFSFADASRQLFWERIQTLAANYGIFRIWTQEDSPFWTRWGFQPANAEILSRLPDEWKSLQGKWLTLELKNEEAITAALQSKFPELMEEDKMQTARVLKKARILKGIIIVTGFTIGIAGIATAIYLLIHRNASLGQ
jgi:N-acetylglutamate synthase-like GNAT family acetyltransferase